MEQTYRTLAGEFRHEIDKVKGSRFLALVAPVLSTEQAQEVLRLARREFHDARHHCSAWRLGRDGKQFRLNTTCAL
jgi:putative IMPACT (imprinted ancient) family translation regulator